VGRALRALGPLATLAAAPRLRRGPFRVEYTIDFDKMSSLSDRWRRPGLLQPDRSVLYLRWLYGSLPASLDPDQRTAVYAFGDGNGREGWFAISFDRRGRDEQIRCARLMDVVWPQERTPFTEVLPAIAEAARPRADVLAIRGRVGLGLHDRHKGLRRRTLLAPEGFLFSRSPATAELAPLADLPFADRY
jgi:hypothetical protein